MASVKLTNNSPMKLSSVSTSNSFNTQIKSGNPVIRIKNQLPFRIKITNTVIESYSPQNPASLGAFIVGYNNYIL